MQSQCLPPHFKNSRNDSSKNSEGKYRSTDLNKHLLSMFTPAAVKDGNRRMQLNFLCAFYLFYFRDTCDILLSSRSCCEDFKFDSFTHFWSSDGCPHIFFNFSAQLQLCSSLDFLNPFIFHRFDWAASIHASMKIQFLMSWLIYVEITISICFLSRSFLRHFVARFY